MKLSELKPGDWVQLNDEGVAREGVVVRVSHEEGEACVDNGIQEFWYTTDLISGLPVNEASLARLGFEKIEAEGAAKYGKGAFRIVGRSPNDFTESEIWYREDRRQFSRQLMVHELQNIHLQMTKVPLEA